MTVFSERSELRRVKPRPNPLNRWTSSAQVTPEVALNCHDGSGTWAWARFRGDSNRLRLVDHGRPLGSIHEGSGLGATSGPAGLSREYAGTAAREGHPFTPGVGSPPVFTVCPPSSGHGSET
jgi:hypothetical protein